MHSSPRFKPGDIVFYFRCGDIAFSTVNGGIYSNLHKDWMYELNNGPTLTKESMFISFQDILNFQKNIERQTKGK